MNIAIFSPAQNTYSETFIQAHKDYLKGTIFYYFGGKGKIRLENRPKLSRIKVSFLRLLGKSSKEINEYFIRKSLKKNKIDVILIEYGTHAYNLLPILKSVDIPTVVHFHGFDAGVKEVIEACDNYKEVFKIAKRVIAVSKVMCQMLLELGCPEEKLVYNVYGPNPRFENVTPGFNKLQFLSVGRFTDKKAPYYTILGFKKVVEDFPDVKLLMAGKGELLDVCKNLVRYFNLQDDVKFLGVINQDEYLGLLEESLAYVQHSITTSSGDMEGTPLSILEASCSGLPIISTFHAGIPDVIIDQKTGLLYQEHDVKGMADGMKLLLKNKNLAKEIGQAGKERVKKHFSMDRHINRLQEILEISTN